MAARLRGHLQALRGLIPEEMYADLREEVDERSLFIDNALVPQEESKPFPLLVPACTTPPAIDGQLDDAAWKQAVALAGFVRPFGRGPEVVPAAAQTDALVTHSSNHLYLAIRCAEPDMRQLRVVRTERDSEVHLEDSLTLYFQPADIDAPFYRVSVNALGTLYDARSYDVNWDGDFEVATSQGTDRWCAEIAVPVRSLGGASVQPGTRWRFSIGRTREADEHEDSSWVVMKRGLHEIERLWTLEFSGLGGSLPNDDLGAGPPN
jgi:hypothetical protein